MILYVVYGLQVSWHLSTLPWVKLRRNPEISTKSCIWTLKGFVVSVWELMVTKSTYSTAIQDGRPKSRGQGAAKLCPRASKPYPALGFGGIMLLRSRRKWRKGWWILAWSLKLQRSNCCSLICYDQSGCSWGCGLGGIPANLKQQLMALGIPRLCHGDWDSASAPNGPPFWKAASKPGTCRLEQLLLNPLINRDSKFMW